MNLSQRWHTSRVLRHGLAWALVVAVLAAVFTLYTRPDFLVRLADQVWSCF